MTALVEYLRSALKFEKPVAKYVIQSHLAEEDTMVRLRKLIQKRTQAVPEWISDDSSPYFGTVEDRHFSAYKLSYRDSFNPQIEGKVSSQAGQTYITLEMSLDAGVYIFSTCLFRITLFAGLIGFIGAIWLKKYLYAPVYLLFVLFPLAFYRFGINSFHREAEKRFIELKSILAEDTK